MFIYVLIAGVLFIWMFRLAMSKEIEEPFGRKNIDSDVRVNEEDSVHHLVLEDEDDEFLMAFRTTLDKKMEILLDREKYEDAAKVRDLIDETVKILEDRKYDKDKCTK